MLAQGWRPERTVCETPGSLLRLTVPIRVSGRGCAAVAGSSPHHGAIAAAGAWLVLEWHILCIKINCETT
jgi:hypothetical protein